jgi:hypothetical protein
MLTRKYICIYLGGDGMCVCVFVFFYVYLFTFSYYLGMQRKEH